MSVSESRYTNWPTALQQQFAAARTVDAGKPSITLTLDGVPHEEAPIVSAIERMAERKGVKLLMLGKSGIGKTTRLKDLDPPPRCSSTSRPVTWRWPTGRATPSARLRGRRAATSSCFSRARTSRCRRERVLAGALRPRHREVWRPGATRPLPDLLPRFDHPAVPPVLRVVQDAASAVSDRSGKPDLRPPMACSARK